jgi:ubiquinol-cytochrome c reductase iron-sulfur subunit
MEALPYSVIYGKDHTFIQRQSASECLELVKLLQAKNELDIKILDQEGIEISVGDLEKRHKCEVERGCLSQAMKRAVESAPPPTQRQGSFVEPTRRNLIYVSTAATGVIGFAGAMIPLIEQMNPDASTVAAGGPIDIDLGDVEPGTASNWHRSITPEIAVLVGVCTHLGCIPQFNPSPNATEPAPNWRGGYFCSCHGSMYDLAGRVFRDVPAPYNLPVPPYRFISDTVIRIGENPPNVSFDFSSIEQV